jgi:DNA-binding transcriptional LysR family regulator
LLDGISLDQLRTFIAAADEGSFSAAGRRLKRAQSSISQTVSNLEDQLGVRLFDRTARFPVLTNQGRALLANAHAVTGQMDLLKARAKSLAGGREPELTVVVDAIFPIAMFTGVIAALQVQFPETALRLYVKGSGTSVQNVLDRPRWLIERLMQEDGSGTGKSGRGSPSAVKPKSPSMRSRRSKHRG